MTTMAIDSQPHRRRRPIVVMIGLAGVGMGVFLLAHAWTVWRSHAAVPSPASTSAPADLRPALQQIVDARLPGIRAQVTWATGEATITLPIEPWAAALAQGRGHFLTRATLIAAPCLHAHSAVVRVRIVGEGIAPGSKPGAPSERLFDLALSREAANDETILTPVGLERRAQSFWMHAAYR